jgi:uncharacterized pyridoxal phosphate-containing UPF0001 family protein
MLSTKMDNPSSCGEKDIKVFYIDKQKKNLRIQYEKKCQFTKKQADLIFDFVENADYIQFNGLECSVGWSDKKKEQNQMFYPFDWIDEDIKWLNIVMDSGHMQIEYEKKCKFIKKQSDFIFDFVKSVDFIDFNGINCIVEWTEGLKENSKLVEECKILEGLKKITGITQVEIQKRKGSTIIRLIFNKDIFDDCCGYNDEETSIQTEWTKNTQILLKEIFKCDTVLKENGFPFYWIVSFELLNYVGKRPFTYYFNLKVLTILH